MLYRPYDSRILIALGDTYHSLDKNEEAKKVYFSVIAFAFKYAGCA